MEESRGAESFLAQAKEDIFETSQSNEESDDKQTDGPLTPEEEAQARVLTAADLKRIDECLLSNTTHQWCMNGIDSA